ncbi:glycosyltransferase 87 family protein [Nocardioides sp. B-3]|uniref:glycosyltransferase 87 family protein n=1 Tax=Nocardioides sp. B-3 TaxID=2895565 RepID=UPI0021529C5E|nr:glycosyltransferase 87 family protein [Nocardioides sp. B-3]UUZ58789.1 glycosyltransferase 87 family protein [Nocardioides sp. B-3]
MLPAGRRDLALAVALTWLASLAVLAVRSGGLLDLAVYRAGAQRLLDGTSIYTQPYGELPFTYPPFGALVMVPLAVLPTVLAELLLPLLSAMALVFVWQRCGVPSRWLVLVAPASLLLEPVWLTQHFGQVNLVLLALVLGDLVGPTSRWRGVLTGVAAGIKLTPLVFLGYLIATRQWRAAGVMAASFAATVALPIVLIPSDGLRFWTSVLPDARRIGAPWYAANQSLMGALSRVDGPWMSWFVLSVTVVLLALWLSRSLHRRGDVIGAVSATGLASLLASPVSWSHHWVWSIPLGMVLLRHAGPVAAAARTLLFVAAPHLWMPSGGDVELTWTRQHVPGDAFVWAGLARLAIVARTTSRYGRGRDTDRDVRSAGQWQEHRREAARG